MTAPALLVFAAAAYFGLARNVICSGAASSMPATPVISASGEPFSNRACNADAISPSFMSSPITPKQHDSRTKGHACVDLRILGGELLSEPLIVIERRELLSEHRNLPEVLSGRLSASMRPTDDCQHRQ